MLRWYWIPLYCDLLPFEINNKIKISPPPKKKKLPNSVAQWVRVLTIQMTSDGPILTFPLKLKKKNSLNFVKYKNSKMVKVFIGAPYRLKNW